MKKPRKSGSSVHFYATRAFAAGLTGLATIGGLAFWASTLGNLGAYILLAKGVSLLAALGISVGGTAAQLPQLQPSGAGGTQNNAGCYGRSCSFCDFSGGWEKEPCEKVY